MIVLNKPFLIASLGFASLGFGQSPFMAEDRWARGNSGGPGNFGADSSLSVRHSDAMGNRESVSTLDLPGSKHLSIPSRAAISLKRLQFEPSSTIKKAFSASHQLKTKGRTTESISSLRHIVEAEPDWFEAWVELGRRQAAAGEAATAANSLQKALAIDPNAIEVYPALGVLLLQSGQLHEAILTARSALKRNPDCHQSKYVLGLALATNRVPSLQAASLLDEVQSHFPDAMLPLATLRFRLGQFEASRDTAWRYLHMAKSPRTEIAELIWREASRSLHASQRQ